MQYMILIYVPAVTADSAASAKYPSDKAAWSAYTKAMIEAGVMRGGNELMAGYTATTIRLRDGARDVQDGPFADSKEELGGYYLIDAPDLDTALQWAARCPAAAYGAVELRPVASL